MWPLYVLRAKLYITTDIISLHILIGAFLLLVVGDVIVRQLSTLRLKDKVALVVALKGFIFLYLWNLYTKVLWKFPAVQILAILWRFRAPTATTSPAIIFGFALADCASNTLILFWRIKSHWRKCSIATKTAINKLLWGFIWKHLFQVFYLSFLQRKAPQVCFIV